MRLRLGVIGMIGLALAAACPSRAAPYRAAQLAQREPQLRAIVQQAIHQAQCFPDRYDSAVWYTLMEPRLLHYVRNARERVQILRSVYCETHRAGLAPLPPGLVMAMLDVESGFNRWAVSSSGAVGLMQVMPFWPERLGMHRYQLVRVAANIRMGCAILRYYLRAEHHDFRLALERYNGSVGNPRYANAVIVRWTEYWNGADGLGRRPPRPGAQRSGGRRSTAASFKPS